MPMAMVQRGPREAAYGACTARRRQGRKRLGVPPCRPLPAALARLLV